MSYLCGKPRTYNSTRCEISKQVLYISFVCYIFAPVVVKTAKHKVARMVESVDTKDLKSFGI